MIVTFYGLSEEITIVHILMRMFSMDVIFAISVTQPVPFGAIATAHLVKQKPFELNNGPIPVSSN